jgi:hypothetical protein
VFGSRRRLLPPTPREGSETSRRDGLFSPGPWPSGPSNVGTILAALQPLPSEAPAAEGSDVADADVDPAEDGECSDDSQGPAVRGGTATPVKNPRQGGGWQSLPNDDSSDSDDRETVQPEICKRVDKKARTGKELAPAPMRRCLFCTIQSVDRLCNIAECFVSRLAFQKTTYLVRPCSASSPYPFLQLPPSISATLHRGF